MLSIYGLTFDQQEQAEDIILFPMHVFNNNWESSWINSEFGRKAITDIEQIDVLDTTKSVEEILAFNHTYPEILSTGTKNILLCRFLTDYKFRCRMGMMGENCFKWLVEIGKEKDIGAVTTITRLFSDEDIKGETIYFPDLDRYVSNAREFSEAMAYLYLEGFF